jgi:hypothetical protein
MIAFLIYRAWRHSFEENSGHSMEKPLYGAVITKSAAEVWELMLAAIETCDADRLRALSGGNDINEPRFGDRHNKPLLHAIMYALQHGGMQLHDSEKIFRIMDELGADANSLDDEGNTPLSICLCDGVELSHIAEQLVHVLGADATKEQASFDDAVADVDDNDTCELLLRLGLKPEADGRYTRLLFKGNKEKGSADGYEYMLKNLLDWGLVLPDERDAKQNTPLHYVVRVLDCDYDYQWRWHVSKEDRVIDRETLTKSLITILLDNCANPLAKNAKGKTALDIWIESRDLTNGDTDDVEELLLNSMADARECLYLDNVDIFAETDMGKRLDVELIGIIKQAICLGETRGKRGARKQLIDDMLTAEGIPPDGYYYHDCINGKLEIDIAEFRFRHYIATTGAQEYGDIVEKLQNDCGRFYPGIHADARAIFRDMMQQHAH